MHPKSLEAVEIWRHSTYCLLPRPLDFHFTAPLNPEEVYGCIHT